MFDKMICVPLVEIAVPDIADVPSLVSSSEASVEAPSYQVKV